MNNLHLFEIEDIEEIETCEYDFTEDEFNNLVQEIESPFER